MLAILDITADEGSWPQWLERQLMGARLAQTVAELEVIAGRTPAASPTLAAWLGSDRQQVLTTGLSTVPPGKLRQLLASPQLLLDLQELVLEQGGHYWQTRLLAAEEWSSQSISNQVETGWAKLSAALPAAASSPPMVAPLQSAEQRSQTGRPGSRLWITSLASALATAAALLVAVFVADPFATLRPGQQVASGWGWSKPGAFNEQLSPPAYLEQLAASGDEWFRKRPETPAALAKRISEFRQGCTELLLAPHSPLESVDRDWLRERCRAWATKLDGHIAALENGEAVESVRTAADETITKLIGALRTRAASLPAGGQSTV